jgi:hypothetical protein
MVRVCFFGCSPPAALLERPFDRCAPYSWADPPPSVFCCSPFPPQGDNGAAFVVKLADLELSLTTSEALRSGGSGSGGGLGLGTDGSVSIPCSVSAAHCVCLFSTFSLIASVCLLPYFARTACTPRR